MFSTQGASKAKPDAPNGWVDGNGALRFAYECALLVTYIQQFINRKDVNKYIFLLAALLVSLEARAYCEGGYPNISIEEEISKSEFIVVGTVTSRKIVVDPNVDPQGYEAELFQVKVEEVLSGKPSMAVMEQYLTVFNYNASSRYLIGMGEKHLLFVSNSSDGYWINSCGNSSEYKESKEKLKLIKKILLKPHA
jgi:hypothetical protein